MQYTAFLKLFSRRRRQLPLAVALAALFVLHPTKGVSQARYACLPVDSSTTQVQRMAVSIVSDTTEGQPYDSERPWYPGGLRIRRLDRTGRRGLRLRDEVL